MHTSSCQQFPACPHGNPRSPLCAASRALQVSDLQSAASFTDSHQACRSSAALHVHRAPTAKQHTGDMWCWALPYITGALPCGDASRQDMSRHCQPCGRLHDAGTACGSCGAVNSCASERQSRWLESASCRRALGHASPLLVDVGNLAGATTGVRVAAQCGYSGCCISVQHAHTLPAALPPSSWPTC